MKSRLLAISIWLLHVSFASAQPLSAGDRLTRSVVQLSEVVGSQANGVAADLDRIKKSQLELQKLLADVQGGVPAEYEAAFEGYVQLLDSMRLQPDDEKAARGVLFVKTDLQIKLDFARSALNLTPSALLVEVDVHTIQADQEVSGLLIKCNPLGFGDRQPTRHAFPSTTPLLAGQLPPGYYVLFAYAGDVLVGRLEVTLGLTGKRKERVDLPVKRPI